jgi:hypothetical protein
VTRRGDAVPRPLPWTVKAASRSSGDGWDKLTAQYREAADRAWVAMTSDPRRTDNRQHQLKGQLASVSVAGVSLEQWQFEVLAGGRVWYGIDDTNRILWITEATIGHPNQTDTGRRRKR